MIRAKLILLLLLIFIIRLSSAQSLDQVPLSRQDSALIKKYTLKSQEHIVKKNLKEASDFFNQTAMLYWEHNHFKEAVELYRKSLDINNSLGNENGIAMINSNLALLYADMKKYDEALEMFTRTYSIRKAKGEKVGTISALINMSVVLNNLGKYKKSVRHLKEALDIAREMNDIKQMKSCYGMLSETYEKSGKADSAFYYFNYYKSFNEIVHEKQLTKSRKDLENERLRAQLAEMERQKKELELDKSKAELQQKEKVLEESEVQKFELKKHLTKKELQLDLIKKNTEIERLKNKEELNRRKKKETIIFGIAAFLGITALLFLHFYREKKKTNKKLKQANSLIETKNKKIISSLNYAQYLQGAMLQSTDELNKLVKESFIIYEPRDIVGGDFYWFADCGNKKIIAAIDCSGHGVPGAFLTVISHNLLNQIVKRDKLFEPESILRKMDQEIIEIFNQRNTDNSDGMAVGIFVIEDKKCKFAGAEVKLFIADNGDVKTYKSCRFSLGGAFFEKSNITKKYITHEFDLSPSQTFYLSSDGYSDQYGGVGLSGKDSKMKTSGFVNIIKSAQGKPMAEQREFIRNSFLEWKGDQDQTDDVLVLGFKV